VDREEDWDFGVAGSDIEDNLLVLKEEFDPDVYYETVPKKPTVKEKGQKKITRRDKGKTRFTAYMLWAKEARKKILESEPDLAFADVSRRLGQEWANVAANVKYNWKRRAKRLANKLKKERAKNPELIPQKKPGKYIKKKDRVPQPQPVPELPEPRIKLELEAPQIMEYHKEQDDSDTEWKIEILGQDDVLNKYEILGL
jgi:hypothetical protein